jgi:translocation and assembly module TamB
MTSDSIARRIEIATLDVVSGPRRWGLVQPARLMLGHGRFEVASFEVRSDSGRVVAHGAIDRRGTQDFSLDLSGVRLDTFSSWLGLPDLSGTLGGSARLEGTAAAPRAHGEIALALNPGEADAGAAHAAVDWDASRLTLDAAFTPAAGAPLTLAGHLPIGLSLAAPDSGAAGGIARPVAGDVDVRLRGEGVLLSSLAPLLDHRTVVPEQGTLNVDAHLSGTRDAPAVSGRVDLAGGQIELPGLGVTYGGVELKAELEGDRLKLAEARATSGKGSVTAAGSVRLKTLTSSEIAIDIHPRSFAPIRTRDAQAVISGDLALRGAIGAPEVSGNLTLQDSNFYLAAAQTEGGGSTAITLSPADYRMLEETFGYTVNESPNVFQQIYEASRVDLELTLAGNTWVRQRTSPRLAVQLTGKFKIRKAPHGEPQLFGRIAPVPGRGSVEQFARQFEFTGGEIMLNGELKDHTIDVKTEFKVKSGLEQSTSKVVVHLDVQGKLDNLKLILSSDPPLDQSEIISYIITGRTASEAAKTSSDKSSEAASVATQIGMAGVTAKLEDYAQQAIGLDVVEVRQDGLQGTTLIAGRYVTPELYLGFRQPVGYTETTTQTSGTANHTQYELDYAAYQWMSLQLLGATSLFKSYVRARHAY